ncbi:MAG: 1-acyl-sn-glycerol-3-phosphate acyltransferase [candidate division Zixibacteria bacterium]|nr:1-acyl-sn-glycerol-3-phosphate acyltransferase [candidate division Zixibacteria bacterium]
MKSQAEKSFWRVFWHVMLLRPFLRIVFGVNVSGHENLEHLDRYVIIANHNSHLDILLLFYILPISHIRRTRAIADEAYFSKYRLVFKIIKYLFRPIWLTRGQLESKSDPLGHIKARLDAGDNLIIFPEGTRGTPGELLKFKSGIGRLVTQYPDIPIVPVFLTGPERSLPKASALLLPLWNNVIIGPAQKCRGTHRETTRLLQEVLMELARSEAARRHCRENQQQTALKCIGFLGIDGSGKSTMSRMVTENLSASTKVCRISDELEFYVEGRAMDIQPLLAERIRRKISGYAKTAKSLKLYKIPKLAELLLRDHLLNEVQRWYRPAYVTMDGSPLLNLLAWSVLYKNDTMDAQSCSKAIAVLSGKGTNVPRSDQLFDHYPELLQLKRIGVNRLSIPSVAIFIDIDPEEACRRITKRGEDRQVHETKEKLGRLRDGYRLVCGVIQNEWNVPVLVVDGTNTREEILDECLSFLSSSIHKEPDDSE